MTTANANPSLKTGTPEYQREYMREYHRVNKERIKAYYLRRREHFLAYKREYYRKNREYLCLRMRLNYHLHQNRIKKGIG